MKLLSKTENFRKLWAATFLFSVALATATATGCDDRSRTYDCFWDDWTGLYWCY